MGNDKKFTERRQNLEGAMVFHVKAIHSVQEENIINDVTKPRWRRYIMNIPDAERDVLIEMLLEAKRQKFSGLTTIIIEGTLS